MCDRCTVMESAFGLRDPLAPRIALLDVQSSTTEPPILLHEAAKTFYKTNSIPQSEHDNHVDHLPLSDEVTPGRAFTPPSETISETIVTDSSGVPSPSPSVSPKWSNAAALGVTAWETKTVTSLENSVPRSILISIMEHADILDALMLNCPDFPTLFALVASCRTAKRAFEQHPAGIIMATLKTMPEELQYLTVALIGINGNSLGTSGKIKAAMETWLGKGPKPLRKRLKTNPIEIVRKLADSFSAIALFMEVIPKNCAMNFADYETVLASREGLDYFYVTDPSHKHPLLQQTEWSDVPDDTEWDVPGLPLPGLGPQRLSLPLNDREAYRLKRALLRYEIFCAIFYLGPEKYYDGPDHPHRFKSVLEMCRRHAFCKAQAVFLQNYVNPWEIGELAVVSHFMYDLVRNAYFHKYKTLRYDDAYDSWYGRFGSRHHGRNRHDDHDDVVEEFDNFTVWSASQGLTLLQKIYLDRTEGYQALVDKHCAPRYRAAELFVPFEKCAYRHGFDISDSDALWEPRHTWSDTPRMALPSKGWLAKSPASDSIGCMDAYWGEKWMRKIGYYIWDRD